MFKRSWILDLDLQKWKNWRKDNKLSLREAGYLFNVTGEMIRQWEINKHVPSEAVQREMLLFINKEKPIPPKTITIATQEALKNYFQIYQTSLSPFLIAKLSQISINKAKEWLQGDLKFNKTNTNLSKFQNTVDLFLRGERNYLLDTSNAWTHTNPQELKEFKQTTGLDLILKFVNVTKTTYYNWESGKHVPDVKTQEKLRHLIDENKASHAEN